MPASTNKKYRAIIYFVFIPALLAVLNIYIIYPLFRGDFNQNISSIEVAFFTDAKFIYDNFPHLGWQPDWYLGFPFHYIYTPFIPFVIAFLHFIFKAVAFAHFYRILMALFYIIGPITLYFFARYLTGRNFAAFLAALIYSVFPSFSYLIGNTSGYGELVNMGPLQMVILQVFGEGPHLAALSLVPLAALAFLWALRQPKFSHNLLAAAAIGAVALINWFGFVALVLMLLAVWLSEIFNGRGWEKTKQMIVIFLIAYGLIAFWFNFSFLKSSLGFGGGGRGEGDILKNYLKILPLLPILLPVVVALSWLFSKKIKQLSGLFLGFLWLLIFLIITLGWYIWGIAFMPQPPRFMVEVNLAVAVILGVILDGILKKIAPSNMEGKNNKAKVRYFFGGIYIFIVLAFVLYFSRAFLARPHDLLAPHEDIKTTYPYQVAKFLDEKVDQNERVLASGNIAFWLNYFTDVSQVKGAADPAATHPFWGHAIYQITTGENAPKGLASEMALIWLKALNANYIVVNGPGTQDPFYDFKDPEKFEIFKKIYEYRGDVVYEVPLINPSLAQIVEAAKYEALEPPRNGVDYKRVKAYSDWVEDATKPKASFKWLNNDNFEIQAVVDDQELISAQITYDKGWQIRANGKKLKTDRDVMGNLVIFPETTGEIVIQGTYKNNFNVYLGYLITFGTIVYLFIRYIKVKNGRKQGNFSRKKIRQDKKG